MTFTCSNMSIGSWTPDAASRSLFAAVHQTLERYAWVRRHQLQHGIQLAVLQRYPGSAQLFVVIKDPLHARHIFFRPGDMNGIGAKIDTRVQLVFQQSQIFVAGPEQGLNIGRDFKGSVDQADVGPPAAP